MLHTLLYFLALASLSSSANFAKLNHMPVEVLGFYRLGFASILVLGWILTTQKTPFPPLNKKIGWALTSGFFFFLHLWTYKYASKNTSISNTMIIFASNPIWASIGAVIFFNEQLTKRLILSYLLALSGVYVLVAHNLGVGSGVNSGDYAAIASAVFYAVYMLTSKKARHHYDNSFYSLIQYSVCAVLFGLCVFNNNSNLDGYDKFSWLAVAGLVIFPTFLGHLSLTYLVKYMNLSVMSCGKLLEPLLAAIGAYYLFGEEVSHSAWIAFILTGASILILFSPSLLGYLKKIFPLRP
jgi:drug/metabolite transporter (DMT)-like permease